MKEENREKGHGWIELVRLAVTLARGVTSGQANDDKGVDQCGREEDYGW